MQHYVKHYEYDSHAKLKLVISYRFSQAALGLLEAVTFIRHFCYPPFAV